MELKITIPAVGQKVRLEVEGVEFLVGCDGDRGEKHGPLSLCHPETGAIRPCNDVERGVILNAIVHCADPRNAHLPTFCHRPDPDPRWRQMEVNTMPPGRCGRAPTTASDLQQLAQTVSQ